MMEFLREVRLLQAEAGVSRMYWLSCKMKVAQMLGFNTRGFCGENSRAGRCENSHAMLGSNVGTCTGLP